MIPCIWQRWRYFQIHEDDVRRTGMDTRVVGARLGMYPRLDKTRRGAPNDGPLVPGMPRIPPFAAATAVARSAFRGQLQP